MLDTEFWALYPMKGRVFQRNDSSISLQGYCIHFPPQLLGGVLLISLSALALIVMSKSVSKNTRWCGEPELLGTDGNPY